LIFCSGTDSIEAQQNHMHKQHLIIIDGLNGAGKTTVSSILHRKLKRTVLLSFDKTKRLISDYTPNEEYIFLTDKITRLMTKEYLNGGMSVIIESIFPKKEFVIPFVKFAKKKNIPVIVYQIEAPYEIREKRIMQRPLLEGTKRKLAPKWMKKNDKEYYHNKYDKAIIIQSHDKSPEQIARIILKDLKK
jgi:predicted kinase